MERIMNKIDVRENSTVSSDSPALISDSGRVRIGNSSPAFPPVRGRPTNISDTGKVRIGNSSPAFPPLQSR
jgi:hypothetical protein